MALSPIGSSPLGTVVPPGVKPNAAEALKLRAQLDLVYAQLMSGTRHSPQRLVELLNAYLDALRRLHGNVVPRKVELPLKGNAGQGSAASPGPVDVCITPAPPAPFVPIPYPIVPAPAATKTPATKQAQKSTLDATHQNIKSGHVPAAQMGGIVSNQIKGVCAFVLFSLDVKIEGKGVARTIDPVRNNRP
jgi:uncharacterized protein DUF4150